VKFFHSSTLCTSHPIFICFDVKIIVKNSHLSIFINGEEKVSNYNVSYWKEFYNYFKAGVYLQGSGCAKVLFDKLEIKESE